VFADLPAPRLEEPNRSERMKGKHWVAVIMGCIMAGMLYVAFPFFSVATGRVDSTTVSVMIWVAYALCVVMAGLFEYKILETSENKSH
jgi:Mg/Co/Ni transporter MgtE